jgi:transcription initiation factor TFIID TATA-box-binding protein
VQYEPEIFPGLIFRQYRQQKKITLLIFVSGKVVITGAKDVNDLTQAFHYIILHLERFKKQD